MISVIQQRKIDEQLDEVLAAQDAELRHLPIGQAERDFMAPDPASLEGIPPYPGASPRNLTSAAPSVSGHPFATSWFSTSDSVETVVEFYRKAFAPMDVLQASQVFSPTLGYAAWFEMPDLDAGVDVMTGQVHMVTAVRSSSQTYVFVSNSQPTKFLDNAATLPGGLQMPPAALRAQWVDVGESSLTKRTVFTAVPDTSTAEVAAHFAQQFEANGWTPLPSSTQDQALTLEARRAGDHVTVVLKSEGTDVKLLLSIDTIAPLESTPPQVNP